MRRLLAQLLVSVGLMGCVTAAPPVTNSFLPVPEGMSLAEVVHQAASVTPTPRQLSWQELEMTAFLHFGVNTFTGREWGDGTEDPALFNPTELDARQWMRALRDAGVKLVILTAKHHDGFCLWPTQTTEHSVKNSPWRDGRGDVVREVAEAAREYGLKFGVYLSPWDRNSLFYGDSPRYNEFFRSQLRELLTGYGRIDEVWFDGAKGPGIDQEYDWAGYYGVVRELQPQAVIAVMGPDVRWVGTESGYGRETEWSVVGSNLSAEQVELARAGLLRPEVNDQAKDLGSREALRDANALFWYPSEVDVSIRPGWFYHAEEDARVKSVAKLVDIYYNSVGMNSVLLLNVPPDRRGLIHEVDVERLAGLGRVVRESFAHNLAAGADIVASSTARGTSASLVLDDEASTHWSAVPGDSTAEMVFDLGSTRRFNRLLLQEQIRVGQRVEAFVLEAWDGRDWRPVTQGTTIGYKRLLRFPELAAERVRLRILASRGEPTLASFGLYSAPELLTDPVIRRDQGGTVTIATEVPGPTIVYTLDGSEPTPSSPRYSGPFDLVEGGVVRARAFVDGMRTGSATVQRRFDIAKAKWSVVSATAEAQGQEAANAIDERPWTIWSTRGQAEDPPLPHELVIDLGESRELTGFTYLPRQDGNRGGTVHDYAVYVSEDGRTWGESAAEGAFANTANNPVEQAVRFRAPVSGRFLRFVARSSVVPGENSTSAAEIGVLTR